MGYSLRLCRRLGAVAGAAIGLFLSLIPPEPPARLILYGILVALIAVTALVLFLLVLRAYQPAPLVLLAVLISAVTGTFLGPLANVLHHLFTAIVLCGFLGYLLGWLTCLLLCRYRRELPGGRVIRER